MPSNRRSELAWLLQAILIALPVIVLASGALQSLRDDRAQVEQQARDSVRLVAPELARQLGQSASAEIDRIRDPRNQGLIVNRQIVQPAAIPRVPTPDDWPRKLPAHQAQLWKAAQDATYRQPDPAAARRALRALAESKPANPQLRANAELELLQLADWSDSSASPTSRAVALAEQFSDAVTPSGTPVAALALLLALQHSPAGGPSETLLAAVERNTLGHPSLLTPELLLAAQQAVGAGAAKSRVAALQERWQTEDAARESSREWLRHLLQLPIASNRPGEFVVKREEQSMLALTNPVRGGWEVTLISPASLATAWQESLQSSRALPEFAGAVVEIAGEPYRLAGRTTGSDPPPVLAVDDSTFRAGQNHTFTLRLDLSNPAPLLLRSQRHRRNVEWLVASSAATAFIGLVTLWTGRRRQARLNEMQSNFVSSVSHELRAPIAAVRLMAESLESGRASGESRQREYFRLIVQECRRLSALVDNVLDFARIEQGRQRYRFAPVDTVALLRHTVALMQPNAEQRRIVLVLADPPAAWDQRAPTWDGEAVEQSLVNLLDNAIQHSPEGAEVHVEMEICRGGLRLWVRDRGPGIPESDHARIFERFYRRGWEMRRETKGVGIGLSIVKHVAEGHGGRVLVDSAVGRGSSFALELPLDAGAPS